VHDEQVGLGSRYGVQMRGKIFFQQKIEAIDMNIIAAHKRLLQMFDLFSFLPA
jgi:hypothetical protein